MSDIRQRLGLRPIINVAGPMTALGASIGDTEAARAAMEILPQFVEINDLHRKASHTIARTTGAEAGFVTASASAGITLSIAGAMTGADLAKVEQLPDAAGMKDEVVIQMGHLTGYGAQVDQAIRLAGAKVVPFGNVIDGYRYQLEAKFSERTVAGLYVVSYQTVQIGQIPLNVFADICHAKGVPVIVDAASEENLHFALEAGADIVIYSAHKFLRGLTAGIVAGRKELVRATFLQNRGIGRGMKVGKEALVSTIVVLDSWAKRDHAAEHEVQDRQIAAWIGRLSGLAGIRTEIVPDPTGNPIRRMRIWVDEESGTTSWHLAAALAALDRPVIVRDPGIEHGYFELDPCHLHPGEGEIVAESLVQTLEAARKANHRPASTAEEHQVMRFEALLRWPD